jgi:hypothetical protein
MQINFDKAANAQLVKEEQKKAIQLSQQRVANIENMSIDLQRYAFADTFATALQGTGEGAYRAFVAFNTGRPREGGAEILRMVGSAAFALRLLGKMGGPVGILIGELLGTAAAICQGFESQQESMAQQIEKELLKFGGDQLVHELAGVQLSLKSRGVYMSKFPSTLTWEQMASTGGCVGSDEIIILGKVESWILDEQKQDLDIGLRSLKRTSWGSANCSRIT